MPKEKENFSTEEKLKKMIIPKEEEPYKIPNNWLWTRLREITNILNGDRGKNYPSKNKLSKTGIIPFISAGNLENGKILKENLFFLTDEQYEKLKAGKLKENDLLFCIRGSLGKYGINHFTCGAIASSLVIIRSILKKQVTIKYLENYFKTTLLKNEILKYNNGTAQPNLSAENLKIFLFPLPPLEEQKRIVEKLDFFFEKTQKIKKIIEEVKEKSISKKENILSKAFRGELTEKWRSENKTSSAEELLYKINEEKLKLWEEECKRAEKEGRKKPSKAEIKNISEMLANEDEIPYAIPNNWVWTRLGEIISVLGDGIHGTPTYDENGKYYFINGNNLKNGKIIIKENTKKVNETEYLKYKKNLGERTIFISINGTLGNLAFYNNEKIILGKSACYFNLLEQINKKFIYYLLKTGYFIKYAVKASTGSTIKNLSLKAMENTKIILPPLEEQKEIVRILDKFFEDENKISKLISLENKIEILEKTILDKAFRGELGTGNIDDIPAVELLKNILETNK